MAVRSGSSGALVPTWAVRAMLVATAALYAAGVGEAIRAALAIARTFYGRQ